MNKKVKIILTFLLSVVLSFSFPIMDTALAVELASPSENAVSANIPTGYYRNELSNELTPVTVKNLRPVAVMVDNEKTALDHYGTNKADIVYEMVNSTANGRVTRLMCIYKNWPAITQVGSIRSARPTNFMIIPEYNAILCHDGGPFYINPYVKKKYIDNLSGGFARFSNGKRTEFTEYVTFENYTNPKTKKNFLGLYMRISAAKYTTEYNDYSLYKTEPHFKFSEQELTLDRYPDALSGIEVELPFPHNSSKLIYNPTTKTYDYYEYGKAHIDATDNTVTTFKNAIIMCADMKQLDANGYMEYNMTESKKPAYYLTDGKVIPITWSKNSDKEKTQYFDAFGSEITLNTGKIYIGIVPTDSWKKVVIK